MKKPYQSTISDLLSKYNVSIKEGLSEAAVTSQREKFGVNELPEPESEPLWRKFVHQFTDILILILLVATGVSVFFGEYLDAVVILVIVILNGVLGFVQEYKAEKSLEALKKMAAQFAMVIREGKKRKVSVSELVPGDIVELNAGDKVPADCRLVKTFGVTVQEAILTGESLPISKKIEPIHEDHVALGDQRNMLFKDTIVASGNGYAIVVATGDDTEVGKISELLSTQETRQTPLQEELDRVGKFLSVAAFVIIILVFFVGILVHTADPGEMFLTAVALAVAAIPEGLPAVVTIVLSLGVTKMARQKAIVKKLPAVETLGATSIICSDKTGTLTQNRIRLAEVVLPNEKNSFEFYRSQTDPTSQLMALLESGIVNSDAELSINDDGSIDEVGDQTEVALLVGAEELGLNIESIEARYEILHEIPFNSDKKYMATIVKSKQTGAIELLIKGAPEVLLSLSTASNEEKKYWTSSINDLAADGLRTLAFGRKPLDSNDWQGLKDDEDTFVQEITFLGMVGERDPLRPEVMEALTTAKKAGVRTVMITGDHKLTALSIAKELGLASSEEEVLTGSELAQIDDDALREKITSIHVYARVNPEQKLRLVKMYQEVTGEKVAVTGDGVNDAPAIKAGDIGIAMGIEGTDVTREVADLILEDDNYATIVRAVREGRIIFSNLVKFIRYLISCNISEIFVVFFAILLGYPAPLLPIQLLWVNLVTDGLPALALGVDTPESDVMEHPPRRQNQGILTRRRWVHIVIEGFVIGSVSLFGFLYSIDHYGEPVARTVAFTALSFAQLVHALNNRSEKQSIFTLGIATNKRLLLTIFASTVLQLLVIYTSIGNVIFEAVPLPANVIVLVVGIAFIPLLFVEMKKLVGRRFELFS